MTILNFLKIIIRRHNFGSCLILCFVLGCGTSNSYKFLKEAEEYSRKQEYQDAIGSYRKHIKNRLEYKDRPDWENPYFYLLVIGDLYIGQEKPEEALLSYIEADEKGVDEKLVLDRFRYLANWYENNQQFEKAIEILNTYRDRDSLLFDIMLDRISKELVNSENQGEK